jgi:AcrR family transcriptional regulator
VPRLTSQTRVERRQQLIDAAWRCAATKPFASLTVDEVCTEAGVSKGAFYIYFVQKQDLLLSLLDDEADQIRQVMESLTGEQASGIERVRRFARAMVRRGDEPARAQIRADLWAEMSSNPAVRRRWIDVIRERRSTLKGWVEESVASGELEPIPATALSAIVVALGDGLLLHAGLDPTAFRWSNVGKALDAILEGIRR